MIIEPELLTTAEAAVYLRCSSSKIYTLINKNELAFLKNGKQYLIPRKVLNDYINSKLIK